MKRIEQNGFDSTQVVEERSEQLGGVPPSVDVKAPFVPQKAPQKPSWKDNGRLVVIGAGIVLVLLLLAFNGMSRKSLPATKTAGANGKQPSTQPNSGTRMPPNVTPIIDTGRSPEQDKDGSLVHPDQIAHTATKQTKQAVPANLGGVRPFDSAQPWQPAPYQPGLQPATPSSEVPSSTTEATEMRSEHDAMDKASLVFVRNDRAAMSLKSQDTSQAIDW